jgi:hypothetical protein
MDFMLSLGLLQSLLFQFGFPAKDHLLLSLLHGHLWSESLLHSLQLSILSVLKVLPLFKHAAIAFVLLPLASELVNHCLLLSERGILLKDSLVLFLG